MPLPRAVNNFYRSSGDPGLPGPSGTRRHPPGPLDLVLWPPDVNIWSNLSYLLDDVATGRVCGADVGAIGVQAGCQGVRHFLDWHSATMGHLLRTCTWPDRPVEFVGSTGDAPTLLADTRVGRLKSNIDPPHPASLPSNCVICVFPNKLYTFIG